MKVIYSLRGAHTHTHFADKSKFQEIRHVTSLWQAHACFKYYKKYCKKLKSTDELQLEHFVKSKLYWSHTCTASSLAGCQASIQTKYW